MPNKTIGAIVALIIAVSIASVGALTYYQPKSNSDTYPTASASSSPSTSTLVTPSNSLLTQPTNQKELQNYTGNLVSYNYITSQTKGVESTQLFFTNKTFNYAGYIALENNHAYYVTFYSDNPNQAQNVTQPDLTTGVMHTEQVWITNVAFSVSGNQIAVTVQNSGDVSVTITEGHINGVNVSFANPITISNGEAQQIILTSEGIT